MSEMTQDELESLCARLERELEESVGVEWMGGPTAHGEPSSSYEWRERQRARIAEVRAIIAALTTPSMRDR